MAQILHQFDYLTELSDRARQELTIPDDATIVNITDEFRQGGPIVISYMRKCSEEERLKNCRRLQAAIDMAIDELAIREAEKKLKQKAIGNSI